MHRWESWKPEPYIPPQPFNFYKIMVPTRNSVAHKYLLSSLREHRPVLLLGESGTAKTLTVSKHISALPSSTHGSLVLCFSIGTKSQDVQASVEASISKQSGSIYVPTGRKKLVVFIDDFNMPEMDQYGTREALALLLFLIGKGCLYDRGKAFTLKNVCNVEYVAAMRPVGGAIDPRLLSLFSVVHFPQPSNGTLELIFKTILSHQLGHFVNSAGECITSIVRSTLSLFQAIKVKLPATPSKFHYIFTLRDLSSIVHGLCLADAGIIGNTANPDASLIRTWRAECLNVFSDRLVGSDPDIFKGLMADLVNKTWPETSDIILANPVMFGDLRYASSRLEGGEAPQVYEDLDTHGEVRKIFEQVLDTYNVDRKPMNLVLFDSAIEHATRLHRIIRRPRGHALLVGVGGNGKKSLTRLVTYAAGCSLFEIKLHRHYGEPEFREDLKSLFRSISSKKARSVIFLFTDSHIVQKGFMEYINNILTTGQIPSLFDKDEIGELVRGAREEAKSSGAGDAFDTVWSFLADRWKEMLHIVLAVSPSGDALRVRCRDFPGMISAIYIDWYRPWPKKALDEVADAFVVHDNLSEGMNYSPIVETMVHTHTTVVKYADQFVQEMRRNYAVTPADYLNFIGNYHKEVKECSREITITTNRLNGGLGKLTEAAATVEIMQRELSEKKMVVDEKMVSVQELIAEIQGKSGTVLIQKNDAAIKEEEVEVQAKLITQERNKANNALMQALPAVEAAAAALSNLDKRDLDEIKGFTNPPQLIKDVCMQVCVLRPGGEKYKESWADAKRMTGNIKFLDYLKGYPKDSITGKMMNAVKKYFKNPNLTVENMTSVSKAGTGLLIWVNAIAKYYEVAKNVEPLRERVKRMEISQQKATQELSELKKLLKALCDEISQLNESLAKAKAELDKLEQEASVMTKRISVANQLVTGLAEEQKRWTQDIEMLACKKERLLGDCLIGSCFLSYLGAFTADYRHTILEKKILPDVLLRGIKITAPCSLRDLLSSEALIQKWSISGLPTDEHSIQNGILTTRSSRFPLCIDPQHQVATWIKRTHGESLIAKTLNEPDFVKHLELAIQFGRAFLFEDVDQDPDPLLDPVLDKNIIQTGSRKLLILGEKEIDWDDNFSLYLTTKLANPVYSPEVMNKTTLVNYGLTMDGLTDRLLNVVVVHERDELEKAYTLLVQNISESTQLLASLEDRLLKELGSSEGNILDNEKLLEAVEDTKTEAADIICKLKKSENTRNEIQRARDVYKPIAKRGSIMYFAESCLSSVMSMYETSLDSFLSVYKGALSKSPKYPIQDGRISSMIQTITSDVYDYTCIGIFESNKLVFAFQMTCMILEGDGRLDRHVLDFFLRGDTALGDLSESCPCNWLGAAGWKDFSYLTSSRSQFSNSRQLKRLGTHFIDNLPAWKTWYDLEAPENAPLPSQCGSNATGVGLEDPIKLNSMEKLCVMRCLRPDRVIHAMRNVVTDEVGKKFIETPVLDYKWIHSQSSADIPLIIILSPGADPQSSIEQAGKSLGLNDDQFRFLSFGQGQGTLAENMIKESCHLGQWVILQNCHLLTSWMKKLGKWLQVLLRSPHPGFRLWLTTEPTDSFPLGILQRSFKVVTEPADGLKFNMQGIWSSIAANSIPNDVLCSHSAYRPCVFVLSFLHTVLLERNKYGKIGWNVKYDFNESDFNISRQLLELYLMKAQGNGTEAIPWSSLKKFYFSREGYDYQLPKGNNIESFLASVKDLPITNLPSVFGLHPNAEIEYYSEAARSMWSDLLSLQSRKAPNLAGMSLEDCIASISKDISERVPIQNEDVGSFDLATVYQSIANTTSPTHIVLMQELKRWNKLCFCMISTLRDLQQALRGEIGMNDTLDKLGLALYNARVPNIWRKFAPETLKSLGSWMAHFLQRYSQYKNWVDNGTPAVMWLSGLHVPESYLTAVMQTTCRSKRWPLDKLTLYTSITDRMDSSDLVDDVPENGSYITGLYLEGASWDADKKCLCRQRPKVLIEQLPILLVVPIEKSKKTRQHSFRTPVYVTSKRRNAMGNGFVFEADLRTLQHTSHWILQGTACVLNDNS